MKRKIFFLGVFSILLFQSSLGLSEEGFEPGDIVADNEQLAGRQVEQEKRVLLRILDDLKVLSSQVEQVTAELQREKDAITPLESHVRADDLDSFSNWYFDYGDWLKEKQAKLTGDLEQLSSYSSLDKNWQNISRELSSKFKRLDKELDKKARQFEKEEKRLAAIIDRRRLLQDNLNDLEERLARIEKKQAEQAVTRERDGRDRREEHDTSQLRNQISIVQTELLSLPLIDEDILKHYMNLAERAQTEADWMLAKSNEYAFVQELTAIISGAGARKRSAIEATQFRVRQIYEQEINRMQRRIDSIDRKRLQISPAGSLREVGRSAELGELYLNQKMRLQDYINRLQIQSDCWIADLSELL